jgi:nucleoside-diphosphate-sugar epimerase
MSVSHNLEAARELVRRDCAQALDPALSRLEVLRDSTIVVTGGTGFVGTWIAEAIAALNDVHEFGISLIITSRTHGFRSPEKAHLALRNDITLETRDVRTETHLPAATRFVIHLAGNPDSRHHASYPLETMSVVGEGTAAALRATTTTHNLRKFLNMSSATAYGPQPLDVEAILETSPDRPLADSVSRCYAEAKRYGEALCIAARSQSRVPTVSVRPFAFIGPYHDLGTPWAINSFVGDALHRRPIRVLGDGQTVRSYLYGADVASWVLQALTDSGSAGPINIGSPHAVSLLELAQLVSRSVSPALEIDLGMALSDTAPVSRLVPDVARATGMGAAVTIGLDSAVSRTLEWNRLITAEKG